VLLNWEHIRGPLRKYAILNRRNLLEEIILHQKILRLRYEEDAPFVFNTIGLNGQYSTVCAIGGQFG